MKKTISLLMTVLMLVGIAAIPSFAASSVTPGEILFKQNFDSCTNIETSGIELWETGENKNKTDMNLRIIDNHGNRSLLMMQTSNWDGVPSQIKIADASVFEKVKNDSYTIQFTMNPYMNLDMTKTPPQPTQYINQFAVRFGALDPEKSYRVGEKHECSGSSLEFIAEGNIYGRIRNYPYPASGEMSSHEYGDKYKSGGEDFSGKYLNRAVRYAIEVDTKASTVIFYKEGEKISTSTCANVATSNGLFIQARSCRMTLDDFVISAGKYQNAPDKKATQEKIEMDYGYSGAKWADKDYSGKKKGEVVFSEDFKNAKTVEDLGWGMELDNTTFMKSKIDAVLNQKDPSVKITGYKGTFGAIEVIPEAAVKNYDVYTLHFKLNLEKVNDRFTIYYNTSDPNSTANCGFMEFRWNPVTIQNKGILNGTEYYKGKNAPIVMGSDFDVALEVDCENGTSVLYLDGTYFCSATNVNKVKSAVYFVTLDTEAVVKDIKLSAGTYDDYTMRLEGKDPDATETDPVETDPPVDETTAAPVEPETPDVDVTTAKVTETEAAKTETEEKESKGCKSSVTAGTLAMLVPLTAVAYVASKKKRK